MKRLLKGVLYVALGVVAAVALVTVVMVAGLQAG